MTSFGELADALQKWIGALVLEQTNLAQALFQNMHVG